MRFSQEEKEEIRIEWRDGREKNARRIRQLAELHACDEASIRRVLGMIELRKSRSKYNDALKKRAIRSVENGMTYSAAAKKAGVPRGTLESWVRKSRREHGL